MGKGLDMFTKKNTVFLQNILLIVLLALLVLIVLVQTNPLVDYPDRDGGSFNYIGSLILKGKIPYVDVWDQKPPGIFYLNALGLWLGHGTRWGVWFMEFVFGFGYALTGYILMRKLWNNGAALFGTAIWLIGFNKLMDGGNFTEEYSLLFNFVAIYVFWMSLRSQQKKIYDFILGLTLALSFLFRANNIGVQISIALTLLIVSLSRRELIRFLGKMLTWGLAAILVLGCVAIYFAVNHALGAMLEASIFYNFSYSGEQLDIVRGLKYGFYKLGPTTWIALAGYLLALWMLVRYKAKGQNIDAILLLIVIGWPVELVLSSLSGRSYPHYYLSWLPVMSLTIGLLYNFVSPYLFPPELLKLINERSVWVIPVLIGLVLIHFQADLHTYVNSFHKVLFDRSAGIQMIHPIADYIRANTDPDDTVLVWGGQSGINFMAQRDSPVAQIWYPLYVDSPVTPKLVDGFLHDVSENKPELIIADEFHSPSEIPPIDASHRDIQLSNDQWISRNTAKLDQFFSFFDANYTFETVVDKLVVYRLNRVGQ